MKRLFRFLLRMAGHQNTGFSFFLHNSVILLLFFALCRLYSLGFWITFITFFFGHAFLYMAELVYVLAIKIFTLIKGMVPVHVEDI